jgi:hypothetical protein
MASKAVESERQVVLRLGLLRDQFQGSAQGGDACIEVSELILGNPEQAQHLGIARLSHQELPIEPFGLVGLTCLMKPKGLLKEHLRLLLRSRFHQLFSVHGEENGAGATGPSEPR